jgi:hypothetical protein
MKKFLLLTILSIIFSALKAQDTAIQVSPADTLIAPEPLDAPVRIINLNPFFTIHVDSTFQYRLEINKNPSEYFWFLRNSPVGLRINKDNGTMSFRADKSYFLSGKLKYDVHYKVIVGVQNLNDAMDRVDTSFTIVFYNTEILPSYVKPSVSNQVWIEEGETISFHVLCETGSFPIEEILTVTGFPIRNYKPAMKCGDLFSWVTDYEIANDRDSAKLKPLNIYFIGSTRFGVKDTALVRVYVRDALNYPVALMEYHQAVKNTERYILQLKYTFLQLDKRLKKTKRMRTAFDLTSASTSLTGTILSTSSEQDSRRMGQILPSIGLALVPIKEAASPNKVVDQNQAALIRTSIKRLEFILSDNAVVGEKDPEISKKTAKLKDELKQVQIQLIDVPIELTNDMTEEELNRYFNSPKVNKKYRLRGR